MLGMRPALENLLDEGLGRGADRGAPAEEPRRTPLQMRTMRLRHVLRDRRVATRHKAARMQPDARAPLKDLDGGRREAHVEQGVDQRMRDRVVMALDLDVVVDVDARAEPVGVDKPLGRQRLQRGSIEALEEIAPRDPAIRLHRTGIERDQQLANARIQRVEPEEGLVAQPRQNPSFGDLHGDFGLRFVARFRGTRRNDDRVIVLRPTRRTSAARPARSGTAP